MPQDWNERFRQIYYEWASTQQYVTQGTSSDWDLYPWQTIYASTSDTFTKPTWKQKERRTKLGNSLD